MIGISNNRANFQVRIYDKGS